MIGALPTAAEVIPHQHDAVLLDAILHADEERVMASLMVRPGTAFSDENGSLPGWAGPEIMAQAIAAFAGCRSMRARGATAEIGLLLGIRDYTSTVVRFAAGEQLTVNAVRSSEDELGRGVFDCRILRAGVVVAAGTLTVFQPTDGSFLEAERNRND